MLTLSHYLGVQHGAQSVNSTCTVTAVVFCPITHILEAHFSICQDHNRSYYLLMWQHGAQSVNSTCTVTTVVFCPITYMLKAYFSICQDHNRSYYLLIRRQHGDSLHILEGDYVSITIVRSYTGKNIVCFVAIGIVTRVHKCKWTIMATHDMILIPYEPPPRCTACTVRQENPLKFHWYK